MAQTKTELFNLAAHHLGAKGTISSATTNSRANQVFKLWEPFAVKLVLGAAHWPSARAYAKLNLRKERDGGDWTVAQPAPGFLYTYNTPSDMLRPRELSTGSVFELGFIKDDAVLHCSEKGPILSYTKNETNYGKWDNDLFMAVSYALAAMSAQTITGQRALSADVAEKANQFLLDARTQVANRDEQPKKAVASWHARRGVIMNPTPARYVYPLGQLITLGNGASVK